MTSPPVGTARLPARPTSRARAAGRPSHDDRPAARLAALALIDATVGAYLLQHAVRRQRTDRSALAVVALVLLGCAVALGWLALPEDEPARLPPAPGQLV